MEGLDLELYNKRLVETNGAFLEALRKLDVEDPNYGKNLQTLQRWYESLIKDVKILSDAEFETRRLNIEETRNKSEGDRDKWKIGLGFLNAAAGIGLGIAGIVTGMRKFKMSTKYEEDNIYTTTTERTVVQEGLKDRNNNLFNLFK